MVKGKQPSQVEGSTDTKEKEKRISPLLDALFTLLVLFLSENSYKLFLISIALSMPWGSHWVYHTLHTTLSLLFLLGSYRGERIASFSLYNSFHNRGQTRWHIEYKAVRPRCQAVLVMRTIPNVVALHIENKIHDSTAYIYWTSLCVGHHYVLDITYSLDITCYIDITLSFWYKGYGTLLSCV